jgi:hypothetical protein
MRSHAIQFFLPGIVAASMLASASQANVYSVNRSFTDGLNSATLTGTVEVPFGDYVIQNAGPSPFTDVDLTLDVNASLFHLTIASTDLILGTGQFFINAGATTLTFDTANADGGNPADLAFFDVANNVYAIGYNGAPGFQVAYTSAGDVIGGQSFPTVFGTIVPEPSAAIVVVSSVLALLPVRRRRRINDRMIGCSYES